MKIAWFTPYNNKSAIAKVSKFIAENFAKTDTVDIWYSDPSENSLPYKNKKIHYNLSSDLTSLLDYDHIIYNMGNNHIFHGDIYEVSQLYPGVVILHDYTLHIFFEELFKLQKQPENYLNMVSRYYGTQALEMAKKSLTGEMVPTLSRSDKFVQMPLFEPSLVGAKGAFLHSMFLQNVVNHSFILPTEYSYLPFPLDHVKPIDKNNLRTKLGIPKDKIIFLSTGIVHPVKRIEKFIEAWGQACNKNDFYYYVIGDYGPDYFSLLNKLAEKGQLTNNIKFLGWTSESTLTDYLNAADIAINLRYPNSEGCSYSAVEQLAHGLALICNNSGFYSELPDHLAYKINLGHEITEIKQVIESIKSIESIQEKSKQSKLFAQENFHVQKYISKLKSFLDSLAVSNEKNYHLENYLSWISNQFVSFFGNKDESIIEFVDSYLTTATKSTSALTPQSASNNKTLGIWFGFPYPAELRREGITRFAVSFATALIKEFNYNIEVWCYDFNKKEMEISFSSILSQSEFKDKIKIVTEINYTDTLLPNNNQQIQEAWIINNHLDNLHLIANKHSKADTFLVAIIYLINAAQLNKKILVAAHDLQPLVDYNLFCEKDPNQKYYISKIYESAQEFVNKGAQFFSNSQHVMTTQIRHFLPKLDNKNSHFIYLPGNFPKYKTDPLPVVDFKRKFQITKPYIFLATQFRPYKNIICLLKACLENSEFMEKYELIFTGNTSDDPQSKKLIEETALKKITRMVGPLTEDDLRDFYLNSEFVVVPTLFEGGFPWQAIEGMSFGKPVLMSKIPITTERLSYEGYAPESVDFMLFDPNSPKELSDKMTNLIANKPNFLARQKPIAKGILEYDWKKAIKIYTEKLGLLQN